MGKGILVIERTTDERKKIAAWLEAAGHVVATTDNGQDGLDLALSENFTAVVTGHRLPDTGGLEIVSTLRHQKPRLPVILIAQGGSSHLTIDAIKSGAFDFLTTPLNKAEFLGTLAQAVEASLRMTQPVEFTADIHENQDTLIGTSRAMQQVYKDLARISPTPTTVLVRGETGTGKELIARAIYQHGHRAHMPFVAVNCAAIPENLLESELFGHEKGAFTGATSLRIGRFEQAHNATLFLDEIGDMDANLQTKILRVLQEKTIHRVGGNNDIPVDVRIIAGTHRDLEAMMARGEFRIDLFYRLNVASIQIPPLREHPEDIPLLIDHFLSRFAKEYGIGRPSITRDAVELLSAQSWPGNVRQLQNAVRKALLSCRGYAIGGAEAQAVLDSDPSACAGATRLPGLHSLARSLIDRAEREEINNAHREMVACAERELLAEAVKRARGNQAKAARWLGLSRLTLRTKLKAFGLHPKGAAE